MDLAPATPRIKVGLAALCAAWFQQIGVHAPGSCFAVRFDQDCRRMVEFLQGCFDEVVAPGMMASPSDAERAAAQFRREQVDGIILAHMAWSEDPVLIRLLDCCPAIPLWLWNYHATGSLPARLTADDLFRFSGTVGLLQGSAPMRRRGVIPSIVSGVPGDAALTQDLRECNEALRIKRIFSGLRAGQIAGRCEAMTGTFVDDKALGRLGVTRVTITVDEYADMCEALDQMRVDQYCADLRRRFEVRGVSVESLRVAARNTLALDELVEKHGLGAVAIQDLNEALHRRVGTRPCLYPPRSIARGVAFSEEGDLNTALGMLATSWAAGKPAMYTEIFTFDPGDNVLLMGHAGIQDPMLAASDGIVIVPDLEYRHVDPVEGAWMEFILAPGEVTCVSLCDTAAGYHMTVFEGESLGPPRRIEGWSHAVIRPGLKVEDLLARLVRRGMTQHFAIAHGRLTGLLRTWCELMGVEFFCEEGSK